MFTEVLRIKPVLDESTAKQMETSLSSRFARVAGRFGSGLKSIVKGTVLGISLGLLNRLLNPIEALEEKIKGLLGHGGDVKDLSERLGTSSGNVEQARAVASSFNVSPEQFKEVILKFSDAIEKADEEIKNRVSEASASTLVVGQFAAEKDRLKSFQKFIELLKKTEAGDGNDVSLTTHGARIINESLINKKPIPEEERQKLIQSGDIRRRTGLETSHQLQKDVLGAQQFGDLSKFIHSDFSATAKQLKLPTPEKLGEASDKVASLREKQAVLDTKTQTKDFILSANNLNENMIRFLNLANQEKDERLRKDLNSFEILKKAAISIDEMKGFLNSLNNGLLKILSFFAPAKENLSDIAKSRMAKGFFKDFGNGWK